MNEAHEVPERKGDEELPPAELKLLPKELKYRLLVHTNKFPVIISVDLTDKGEGNLMIIQKMHYKAFGYSMNDFKGISPLIVTHQLFMEEGAQPVANFQRRLTTNERNCNKINNFPFRCEYHLSRGIKRLGKSCSSGSEKGWIYCCTK
jgi:hypothetical protein